MASGTARCRIAYFAHIPAPTAAPNNSQPAVPSEVKAPQPATSVNAQNGMIPMLWLNLIGQYEAYGDIRPPASATHPAAAPSRRAIQPATMAKATQAKLSAAA